MRFTSSYAVFHYGPGEKVLAKARWFSREGKPAEAEQQYRLALTGDPELRAGWLELFELLRQRGRYADALDLARGAEAQFGPDAAMPLAINGAALAELGRVGEAIEALEAALDRDGNPGRPHGTAPTARLATPAYQRLHARAALQRFRYRFTQ